MAGYFLTFEGIDGCGKSTQAQLLGSALERTGHDVVLTHEPGATRLGRQLRSALLEVEGLVSDTAEVLLLAADRAQHLDEVIRPALDQGKVVISDRYADSTRAYQGFGRGVDRELLERAIALATRGLEPDLTILIDVDLVVARDRSQTTPDRLEREPDAFFQRVQVGFRDLARLSPDRFSIVDASQSIDETADAVLATVCTRLPDLNQFA